MCLAISGPTILYGKMQPYLNEVELHEHCYIQGPPGCQGEAIQLFANIGIVTNLNEQYSNCGGIYDALQRHLLQGRFHKLFCYIEGFA